MKIDNRMDQIQSPVIPIIADMIAETPDTISLGQGVAYYGPPAAAYEALQPIYADDSLHKYGHTAGVPQLRDLIAEKLKTENAIDITRGYEVIVTAGSNMGFLNALFAITQPEDEIILPLPYYFNHEMAIGMVGCQAVLVETDENYQLRIRALKQAITSKTRAIVTISPNNPTGVVYSEAMLREVNWLCQDQGIYHISDEAYEYFTYTDSRHFSPASIPGSEDHSIALYSLSKAYGFAHWRVGYMVVPDYLKTPIYKAQDTNLICPPIASQLAAYGALSTGRAYCDEKRAVITDNRQVILEALKEIREIVTVSDNQGAFYLLLKIDTDFDDMSLIEQLIYKYQVAVLPGSTFGMTAGCYLRVAYGALSRKKAEEGIRRLVHGLRDIVRR